MTLATNALTTYSAIGNREDLMDDIYLTSPTDTPFLANVDREPASAVLHEWQTQALAAAATNAVLEGDEPTATAATVTVRLSNTAQISAKYPRVTGTQRAVDSAGRDDELSYQTALMVEELKRDMETVLTANQQENTGNSTTARTLGAIPSWIDTNTSNGATGSDGSLGNTTRTDGTQRAFTESLLATVLQDVWTSGGNPNRIMLGGFNKRQLSTFGGNATRFKKAEDRKLMAGIDVYESDWSPEGLIVSPNRFMRSRDCLILQDDMWAVAFLREFAIEELSKTGDSDRVQVISEYTLVSRNERASGAVWDLTTS